MLSALVMPLMSTMHRCRPRGRRANVVEELVMRSNDTVSGATNWDNEQNTEITGAYAYYSLQVSPGVEKASLQ